MIEQQEKKDEVPAPAPPVHQKQPLDTRLLSEAVIKLNIRGVTGFNPQFIGHFPCFICYQVPA